ncbi:MAG: LysR family transcriptional regulator [Sphaerochaetaceae bacterium]|nr:LysR family transcriptional regulator [Spirochaetales bacterium]MDY5498874.1 LysR family transcriptional regulator [Sphaerochaetaceae bacterium]
MELRQVRYFLTVVDGGSISEGARRLHISQPPLSLAMRQLEEELGAQLFVRGHSRLTLTEAGRAFYQKGQNLVELALQTSREIREMRRERTLHLGVTPTTVPLVMPALQAIRNQDPAVRIDLHDGSTYQLLDLMARRLVDAAVIRTPCSAGNLHQVSVTHDSMLLLSPGGRTEGPVGLEVLSPLPLILYRRYRDFILDAFSHHALKLKLVGECDDARTAISMVRAGLGYAVIPSTMGGAASGIAARPVVAPELTTEILFVWDRDLPLVQEMKEQLLAIAEKKEQ